MATGISGDGRGVNDKRCPSFTIDKLAGVVRLSCNHSVTNREWTRFDTNSRGFHAVWSKVGVLPSGDLTDVLHFRFKSLNSLAFISG
jgi:hypothetical protein